MIKMTDDVEFEILQFMSGNFLCEDFPDNWRDMTEDEQIEFMEDNVWEPFENTPASEVYKIIDNAANCAIQFMIKKGLCEE